MFLAYFCLALLRFVASVKCSEPADLTTEIPIKWEWMFFDGDKEPEAGHVLNKFLTCPAGQVFKIVEAIYAPTEKTPDCLDWATKMVDTDKAGKVCNNKKDCTVIAKFGQGQATPRCNGWVYKVTHRCVPEGSLNAEEAAELSKKISFRSGNRTSETDLGRRLKFNNRDWI